MNDWTDDEPVEILREFSAMLSLVTKDGANKRKAGTKPSWKVDEHQRAMLRHMKRWMCGEGNDPDSGAHPLVHVAWRALAVAWQETQRKPGEGEGYGQS